MGGWLDLTQQGLSPCKKYRASWALPLKLTGLLAGIPSLFIYFRSKKLIV